MSPRGRRGKAPQPPEPPEPHEAIKLGLFGAGGRLARHVAGLVDQHPPLVLAQVVGRGQTDDFKGCDVVIDVATATATDGLLARLGDAALVTGVTGRSAAQTAAVEDRARRAPVLVAANFSLGVAVLTRLVRQAAAALADFDAEIFEIHHRQKLDAPSGTALHLGRAVAEGQRHPWPGARARREGATGPRGSAEVGLAALRGGEVCGEHTVYFFGPGERIELTHRAGDRAVFAHGALRAAKWLVGKPAGLYDIDSMLAEHFRG